MHYLEKNVVRDKKKNLIWVMYSAVQLFIYSALHLLKIKVQLLTLYLSEKDYEKTVTAFTSDWKKIMMLIAFYMLKSVSLNLQNLCWHMILFDFSSSQPMSLQAVEHVQCIDNSSSVVYVTEYYVWDTFNDHLNELNKCKTLSLIMMKLNLALFCDREEGNDNDMYNNNNDDVNLEEWILWWGQLHDANSETVMNLELSVLTAEQILHHILSQMCGDIVTA